MSGDVSSSHDVMDARTAVLAARLGQAGSTPRDTVVAALTAGDDLAATRWLVLACLRAEIPSRNALASFARRIRDHGVEAAVDRELARGRKSGAAGGIEIVDDLVLVDVHDTVGTARTSGIQRVVRETARRWAGRDRALFVAWGASGRSLRRLTDDEREALDGAPRDRTEQPEADPALIPASGRFVVTELVAEPWRARRLEGLAANPRVAIGVIGYDCVPMTSGETSSSGIVRQFPLYLDAISGARVVAAISASSATEFRGWARMVSGSSPHAPRVEAVVLAAEIAPPGPDDLARAASALGVRDGEPLVLVVGSHEPRKNHLAVLDAAQALWREGLRFRLAFLGATSWNSERFHEEAAELARRHPLSVITAIDDGTLSGAYALARFSVFPSLHEGFGLPVAESLALGTPAVTSGYGSMAEIVAAGGGGVLVDPRDDASVADGMRRLLTDEALLQRLREEAAARPPRTWDAYADELWSVLAES